MLTQHNQHHAEMMFRELEELFDQGSASHYIAAINTFVRPRVGKANKEERSYLYNLLKLMEVLPHLEQSIEKMKKTTLILIFALMLGRVEAQIDMSILTKQNTIWLYENYEDTYNYKGIAIIGGDFYFYSDGKFPKSNHFGQNKSLSQPHLFTYWGSEFWYAKIQGKKIVKGNYSYKIIKVTKTHLVIKDGPNYIKFKRHYTKQKRFPHFNYDGGSGTSAIVRENNGTVNMIDDYIDF